MNKKDINLFIRVNGNRHILGEGIKGFITYNKWSTICLTIKSSHNHRKKMYANIFQ